MATHEGLDRKHLVTAGEAFAERLKQVRTRKGWSQQRLANQLAELGYPINRVTLNKIERGGLRAKNVRLEEVLAIAYALGVSPVWLMAPYSMESRLVVVPALRPSTPGVARRWLAGVDTLADEDPRFAFTERPPEELDALAAGAREIRMGRHREPTAAEAEELARIAADEGVTAVLIRELELGIRSTYSPEAIYLRQLMAERGEAPPIIPTKEEHDA